ncbi:MAG: peptide-methionine (S)-S-oxide reductase MsrA [Actinomycetota bacterium]|nr:peptide-methionine (S)-S-oxide reductase MsrA [Actinomycetota bacterium]
MPEADQALPGRHTVMEVPSRHAVLDAPLRPPFPEGVEVGGMAMGCFWGAERLFWTVPGVYTTAVGYAGGHTANPTYEEVCTGMTGHAETVLVAYDPSVVTYDRLLQAFWEGHDPTQGMRQGNDVGTQYRSMLLVWSDPQRKAAQSALQEYQSSLLQSDRGDITTEIIQGAEFYYAEAYHQQYLAHNPDGYCGLAGTGVPYRPEAQSRSLI